MAAINTAGRDVRRELASGIRPFDIGTDLRPVAELIADAFTNELDPRGKAALREMRIMSHVSGLIKLLSRSTGELDDVFSGYVWLEDGAIVGNITVQRADKFGNRWQIANVAVSPAYRGRGIARMLLQRALEHVDEAQGRWAVLQVYAHNQVARALYNAAGFEEIGGSVEMRMQRLPVVEFPKSIPHFCDFSAHHWQPLYELANNQHNVQAQWWRPIRRSDFQIPFEQQVMEWLSHRVGRYRIYRRCIQSARRFEAALILTAQRWRGVHKLEMWARPEQYGSYESDLIQWTLATLQEYPRWPVLTNVSTEHGAALRAFRQFGFEPLHTLLTMRCKLGD
jgi:ribosomal protein S18 acetylase RimI-like enzyme